MTPQARAATDGSANRRQPPSRYGVARAVLGLLVGFSLGSAATPAERPIAPPQLRSGIDFAGPDVRAMQADAATNPSQLWIEQGRQRWTAPGTGRDGESTPSCQGCHGETERLAGIAAGFPKRHAPSGQLFNLEDQIRHCHSAHQGQRPPPFESDELLALTLLITQASAGMAISRPLTPELQPHFEAGRDAYQRRRGQLNLACTHCHDRHWGQRFHTDTLSQGHPNGYPVYRLEWQKPGSLERRLRSCLFGVRAEIPPWGDLSMRQLSLYLAWRAQGLPVEAPAVRK